MKILVTNDDGMSYQGLQSLVKVLRPMGDLVVIPPKFHQSGASMAVTMGMKPIAVKKVSEKPGEQWWYVDATPSSCVKWALDEIYTDGLPDLVVSGVNHGANAASAILYSGTAGAAKEGALAGVLSIAVSLDKFARDADFSAVEELLPGIIEKIIATHDGKFGCWYNVNFPYLPVNQIKGVTLAAQGTQHWLKEFRPFDYELSKKIGILADNLDLSGKPLAEEGEKIVVMAGDLTGDPHNHEESDCILLEQGYITVSVHKLDTTDYEELDRLRRIWQ